MASNAEISIDIPDFKFPLWDDVDGSDDSDEPENKRQRSYYMLRSGNLHRNRNFTPETISDLTDREFQKTFRMPRFSFRKLLRLVHHDLEVDAVQAFRGSGSMISPSTRLLLTLRYLAGGAYNDLTDYSGVGRG